MLHLLWEAFFLIGYGYERAASFGRLVSRKPAPQSRLVDGQCQDVFGLLLIAVAIWMVSPVLSAQVLLLLNVHLLLLAVLLWLAAAALRHLQVLLAVTKALLALLAQEPAAQTLLAPLLAGFAILVAAAA